MHIHACSVFYLKYHASESLQTSVGLYRLFLSSDGHVCVGRAVAVNRPDRAPVLRGCYCHHLQSVLLECGESLYLHLFSFKRRSGCVYEDFHDLCVSHVMLLRE